MFDFLACFLKPQQIENGCLSKTEIFLKPNERFQNVGIPLKKDRFVGNISFDFVR